MNKDLILHKEIDLIQNCIERMSKSSFLIKGWDLSILGIMTGFFLKNKNIGLVVMVIIINTIFWWLDAYYLREERLYRAMYNDVLTKRNNGNYLDLYSLDNKKYVSKKQGLVRAMFSKTLIIMYGTIVVIALLIIFLNWNQGIYVIMIKNMW